MYYTTILHPFLMQKYAHTCVCVARQTFSIYFYIIHMKMLECVCFPHSNNHYCLLCTMLFIYLFRYKKKNEDQITDTDTLAIRACTYVKWDFFFWVSSSEKKKIRKLKKFLLKLKNLLLLLLYAREKLLTKDAVLCVI